MLLRACVVWGWVDGQVAESMVGVAGRAVVYFLVKQGFFVLVAGSGGMCVCFMGVLWIIFSLCLEQPTAT